MSLIGISHRPRLPDGRAARGRRVDRRRAARDRLGRHAVRARRHSGRRGARDHGLGQQRVVGARRAAAVHLDGRNPVPHQAVGGDVSRPRALAQLVPGPADARERARLRHLRLGVRLVGRDLRDGRQDRAAGTEEARLRRHGVSLGSLAGAGTLGILIPPSITMVVYAVQANVSIIQVFLAGFLPGLLVMALYSGYIAVWSLLNPDTHAAGRSADAVPREAARSPPSSFRCMLLIVLVFLSLLMGWATATECAAWGVLGSLAIAWWHGSLTWPSFWASVMGATRVNCMIMLILAGASYMSTSMAYTGIPNALAAWVGSLQPLALCADRRAHRDVHRARHRARRHLDDRAHHRGGDPDDQAGRLRSRLVRHLRGADRRDGRGVAAGRLQPVRAADHERQGFQYGRARRAAVLLPARRGGCHHHGIS